MFRIDIPSASVTLPTPATAGTPGYFTDGDPGTGAAPTIVPADWMNRVQEELMTFLTSTSLTPSKTAFNQVAKAVQSDGLNYAADTSVSANTITAALSLNPGTPLPDGFRVTVKMANTITGATVLGLNGGANHDVVTQGGAALSAGNLVATGIYEFRWNATATNWQVQSFVLASTGFSTGDAKLTYKTSADSGWILLDDGSIGDGSSSATTRANSDTAALFAVLWNGCTNSEAPVSGGRGGSAAADFAAHKRLTIPKVLGRALAIAGAGSGLTSRALGIALGEETHVLTAGESAVLTYTSAVTDPTHVHTTTANSGATAVTGAGNVPQTTGGTPNGYTVNAASTGVTVGTTSNAGGAAHNNMQPTGFLNIMLKL